MLQHGSLDECVLVCVCVCVCFKSIEEARIQAMGSKSHSITDPCAARRLAQQRLLMCHATDNKLVCALIICFISKHLQLHTAIIVSGQAATYSYHGLLHRRHGQTLGQNEIIAKGYMSKLKYASIEGICFIESDP